MKNSELKKELEKQLEAKAKEYKLSGLEKLRKFHLVAEPFSIQNDLITPTFKIKRNIAKKVFEKEIRDLYAEQI